MSVMKMEWKIRDVLIPNRFVLAPMAGVTDLPFRLLCKEQGAGLLCMEMVSAKAIAYHNKNTEALMEIDEREHPVSLQLFGNEPELMGEVAASIQDRPFDILDINMGCPVPKVVSNGEGSALLKEPEKVSAIIKSIVRHSKKPVTVKMRIGFEKYPVDIVDLARRAQEAGAAAIAIHGRTREQFYSGTADWSAIARVKEAVSIPVIGNGDITSPQKAKECFEMTGCDAVMIGRACRGNPWIFRQCLDFFGRGEEKAGEARPSAGELRETILRHAMAQIRLRGEAAGIREMRKHIAWYTHGSPHSASLRREANQVASYDELCCLLERL